MKRTLGIVLLLCGLGGCSDIQDAYVKKSAINPSNPALLSADGKIRVVLCGTGTPQHNSLRRQACTLVSAGGRIFLFDAGAGVLEGMKVNHVPLAALQQIFITHWHSDHFNGLGALINYSWIYGRSEPVSIFAPGNVERVVDGIRNMYSDDVSYRSRLFNPNSDVAFGVAKQISIPENETRVRVYDHDGVTVDAIRVDHRPVTPAVGYLLTYAGKTVFISGDTKISPLYEPSLKNVDMVVHEVINSALLNMAATSADRLGLSSEASRYRHVVQYHSDSLELAEMSERAGVKHLVLTHITPTPNNFVSRFLLTRGMSDRYTGKITIGKDDMMLEIP